MSFVIFALLLNYFLCREYHAIGKNKNVEFNLDINSEYFASLEYADSFEPDDKIEDNNFYFLKINKFLKVNCIIYDKNIEPDETLLNSTNSTEYCQSDIELKDNKKLIGFPKILNNDTKLYFIFFIDNNENYDNENKTYEINRISFPKLLDINDYAFELKENETFIYLMSGQSNKYNMLSTFSKFNISIYAYSNKSFVDVGYIGENKLIYQFDNTIELDNGYLFVIIDNYINKKELVKFSYFEYVKLYSFQLYEECHTISMSNTVISLLEIYNPENKIIKFNYDEYGENILLRVLDDNYEKFESMENLLDYSYYKYIPVGYYYTPKNYSVFLFYKGNSLNNLIFEPIDINENSTEIQMEDFYYFKLYKNNELSFDLKPQDIKIILKLIGDNLGSISINNEETYSFTKQNQILEIDKGDKDIFNITSLDSDLILAIKSKIPEENIHYAKVGEDYHITINQNKTFIIFNIDYDNYDYIQFEFNNRRPFYKYKISTDFGFFNQNEIEKNEYVKEYEVYHDLQYYNNDKNKYLDLSKNLSKIYYISDLSENSDVIIKSKYFKELIYHPNNFTKNMYDNLLNYENKKIRLFFLTDKKTKFEFYCGGSYHGIDKDNSFVYYFYPETDLYCYTIMSFYGYVIGEQYDNDDEIYSFEEENCINTTEIKPINDTYFKLSFDYNFTNASHINYTLILSDIKNKELFNTKINIFENFYLSNKYDNNKEFKFYKFALEKNLILNSTNICTIDLPIYEEFKNKEIVYDLIAETSPSKMINIYDVKNYKFSGGGGPEPENKNYLKIIIPIIILLLIIIIVVIIIILKYKKKREKSLSEMMIDNSLEDGINISMKEI